MPKFSQRQRYTLAILCSLLIAGLVLLSFPAPAEQDVSTFSTPTLTTNGLSQDIGFAPTGYYATAHIMSGNTIDVKLTLVESNLVLFIATFPAGTFDIPNTPITAANGGTVFLTITSHNQVFTQMNVVAKIFHIVTALPFFWAGAGILGLTGLLTLAIFYQHTAAGRLARRLLPVEKAGLGWT